MTCQNSESKCPYCFADCYTGELCPIDDEPCTYNPNEYCENCRAYCHECGW